MSKEQDLRSAVCLKTNICARAQDRTRCVDVQSEVQSLSLRTACEETETKRATHLEPRLKEMKQ